MKKIPIIFDVDTGIDDGTTLMMACISENLEILGVTVSHGNNYLTHTLRNTLNVLKLCGREDIPVAAGAAAPILRKMDGDQEQEAGECLSTGKTGWGDMNFLLKMPEKR